MALGSGSGHASENPDPNNPPTLERIAWIFVDSSLKRTMTGKDEKDDTAQSEIGQAVKRMILGDLGLDIIFSHLSHISHLSATSNGAATWSGQVG